MLRNTQFREDAGPTAHPAASEYQAIDNFYTTTIYEKGAELIRMLRTLLGPDRFMKGMEVYVQRFDGTAATTEDFVQAIADGATSQENPWGSIWSASSAGTTRQEPQNSALIDSGIPNRVS